ncbi:MAG: 1,4-dihydroxy-2-naphthoate octaprenyltransferase [Candidatus Hydrogenedentota bacterium]
MKPGMVSAWVMAARPKTLWASIAPVVIGTAMAFHFGRVDVASLFAALLGGLLIQIGTNFANDYFDFVKGTDTEERIGPARATQKGMVSPGTMRTAFLVVFALVFVPGAYILYRTSWPASLAGWIYLAIGLSSILFGILYTGGPMPLGYIGLGDVFVLVFFGPVAVCGTYYLHAAALPQVVVVAGLAPGLLSVALLAINNLRDVDQDRMAGKRTLAVRFGPEFARVEYLVCVFTGAFVIPMFLYGYTGVRWFALVPLVVLGLGYRAIRIALKEKGPILNDVLASTGKMLLVFSVVFSLCWIL